LRHLAEFLDGANTASDSGIHHLAHAKACCGIVLDALETGNLIDDRPAKGAASRLLVDRSLAPKATQHEWTTQYECVPPARAAWDGTIWPCPDCSAELSGRDAYEQHRWKAHPSQRPLHTGEPAAVSSEHDAVASALDTLEGRRNARPCTCFWPAYSNSQCPIPGHPLPMRERRHQ